MKRHLSTTAFALTLWTVLGFAGPAVAQQQLPFRGVVRGQFTLTPILGTTDSLVLAQGIGEATELGRFQFNFPLTVNIMQTGKGTYTLIAANGDTVIADILAKSSLLPNGLRRVEETATIKGGTGRFAGATGGYVSERFLNRATGEVFGYFTGTISHPGAEIP